MYNLDIRENEMLFRHEGELVRIMPCGRNAIRFQAFPSGSVLEENYNLMPQPAEAVITDHGHCVTMACGDLTVTLNWGGWVSYTYKGNPILADKAEHTFRGPNRTYLSRGDRAWQADVNFSTTPDEKFFGRAYL